MKESKLLWAWQAAWCFGIRGSQTNEEILESIRNDSEFRRWLEEYLQMLENPRKS